MDKMTAVSGADRLSAGAAAAGAEAPAAPSIVQSLLHGLQILEMFGHDTRVVTVGEMAKHLGLHKSSASRLAATLASRGFLEAMEAPGRYRLGNKITTLHKFVADDSDIERVVVPHLQALTDRTGETGHVARLVGGDAVSSAIVDGWHTVRMRSWVGKRSPAYVSSMGKCLLADFSIAELRSLFGTRSFTRFTEHTVGSVPALVEQLARIRELGYSVDDEELELGLRCIGAPIIDGHGDVVASISISGPTNRVTPETVPALAAHVRWAAQQASAALGMTERVPGWPALLSEQPSPLPWVEAVRGGR